MSNEIVEQSQIEAYHYFPTTVYAIDMPEFLEISKEVSEEYLKLNENELDEIYPVKMSENFVHDERMAEFNTVVNQTAWDILDSQGYDMDQFNTFIREMWVQEHHKHSLMEQHIHSEGIQLVGFYFLEAPENCSRPMFHDPRPGKVILNLPERDMRELTPASTMINFEPIPGKMIISNAWLPHSFSRHASEKPVKFIHFNITVGLPNQSCNMPEVEIV